MPRIIVIGAGFSGLSAAAYLASSGFEVLVLEKNDNVGGRASQMKTPEGYVFDMGPSWYWMPEVFEAFYRDFGYCTSQFYKLDLLDPGFEMIFSKDEKMKVPADFSALEKIFESIESGSSVRLRKFMKEAQYKYDIGMARLSSMPGQSFTEFLHPEFMKGVFRLQLFSSFRKHVSKYFKDPRLVSLMEFPVIFLGAMANKMPALYSLMNYAGLKLGTWYPQGGFGMIAEAMKEIGLRLGVQFHFNAGVEEILAVKNKVTGVRTNKGIMQADGIIASADYHHVESELLAPEFRNYNENYWDKKIMAPSALIYYLGITKKISRLEHHTLFFDENMELHTKEIYDKPQWPTRPLFYVCCPSRSDKSVAPAGHENLFFLMPLAPGLKDNESLREQYFNVMMNRLETHAGESIEKFVNFKKSFCINDFIHQYNSYKGNAYGLANTLNQTAILKPAIRNKKLNNLVYAGQLTVPGPGVPPSIISGKLAAGQLSKYLKSAL